MLYKAWIGRDELEVDVLKSEKPSVVVFAAKWCGYCRKFLPIVDAYPAMVDAPELSVVDTDSGDGSLWDEYDINVVPTIVVYRDGKQMFKREGRFGSGLGRTDLEEAFKVAMT